MNLKDIAERIGVPLDKAQELVAEIQRQSEPVALPFAILPEELKDLKRFHECAMDDEGYDVPKDRMKRLAEIGLLRRVAANYYEHTVFGLSVLNGDFTFPPDKSQIEQAATKPLKEKIERLKAKFGDADDGLDDAWFKIDELRQQLKATQDCLVTAEQYKSDAKLFRKLLGYQYWHRQALVGIDADHNVRDAIAKAPRKYMNRSGDEKLTCEDEELATAEQRVAEACASFVWHKYAEVCKQKNLNPHHHGEWLYDIRSGDWLKFVKGE